MFFFAENQEKLYLYLIISVTAGILLCLLVVIVRLVVQRRKSNLDLSCSKEGGGFKGSSAGETTIPNGFSADDISEIDADIDLATPLPMQNNGRHEVFI